MKNERFRELTADEVARLAARDGAEPMWTDLREALAAAEARQVGDLDSGEVERFFVELRSEDAGTIEEFLGVGPYGAADEHPADRAEPGGRT